MTPMAALHPKLAFVDRGGLFVAYRASAAPQRIEVRVETSGADHAGMGVVALRGLLVVTPPPSA